MADLELRILFDQDALRSSPPNAGAGVELGAAPAAVLQTYSGTSSLDARRRQRLLRCTGQLADERYGGRTTKPCLHELRVAERR